MSASTPFLTCLARIYTERAKSPMLKITTRKFKMKRKEHWKPGTSICLGMSLSSQTYSTGSLEALFIAKNAIGFRLPLTP